MSLPHLNAQADISAIGDSIWQQLEQEITFNRRQQRRKMPLLPLQVYRYCGAASSLLNFSARLGVPYDTIATLNDWQHFSDFVPDSCFWLSNRVGIAVPEDGRDHWQQQLFANRRQSVGVSLVLDGNRFIFFSFSIFSARERLLFLAAPFAPPLEGELFLTSHYGIRNSPFSRLTERHQGVDLRSAAGSAVYSVADGEVVEIGRNNVWGIYLKIRHRAGLVTLYGHLQRLLVKRGDRVDRRHQIALSGSSGRVTGPHLHFAVWKNGQSVDPAPYLGLKNW